MVFYSAFPGSLVVAFTLACRICYVVYGSNPIITMYQKNPTLYRLNATFKAS